VINLFCNSDLHVVDLVFILFYCSDITCGMVRGTHYNQTVAYVFYHLTKIFDSCCFVLIQVSKQQHLNIA